jgi:alanyl-tRNA synthetase
VAPERIQRMGEDNFWRMGDTGPCGPSSEVYFDKGPAYGAEGGPARGGAERFVEIWNLVFMQYNRQPDGSMTDLPRRNIDTGAGLERILPVLAGTDSIFATDVLAPLVEAGERLTGARLGADDRGDVALRVLADHGRAMTMLVADGVLPSNEGRGYVLRRLIRRAVLAARRLGTERPVTAGLAEVTAAVMGTAYPAVVADLSLIQSVLEREEAGFDRTLRTGLSLLEAELEAAGQGSGVLGGEVAFRLHDTHGFPIELTEELAREADVAVDRTGFDQAMAAQRERARRAARTPAAADEAAYRDLVERAGETVFVGRGPDHYALQTTVVGLLAGAEPGTAELFLAETPFYAEGGGQVGDTGTVVTETGRATVYETAPALPGLTAHRVRLEGEIFPGQDALAAIDGPRRESTRRNHTGTHLLHAALREVLGPHVKQAGSLNDPARLRLDFSHFAAIAEPELREIESIVNQQVLANQKVETLVDVPIDVAVNELGAMALFGEKYGDRVRVVKIGSFSTELCGGTHTAATGEIGLIKITGENSVSSGVRRVEALSGTGALSEFRRDFELSRTVAQLAGTGDPAEALRYKLSAQEDELRKLRRELDQLRMKAASASVSDAAAAAVEVKGVKVLAQRVDSLDKAQMRDLVDQLRGKLGSGVVVLGAAAEGKVTLIVGVTKDLTARLQAGKIVAHLASLVGGKGGGRPDLAEAGGSNPGALDATLAAAPEFIATLL